MAKQCCVCGAKLTFMNAGVQIHGKYPDYELCPECNARYLKLLSTSDEAEYDRIYKHFTKFLSSASVPQEIKNKITGIKERRKTREEEKRREEEKERDYSERIEKMTLSSSDTLVGYEVVEYLGLVSEDVLFQNRIKNMISSSVEALGETSDDNVWTGDELSVVTKMVEKAKQHVIDKMCRKAAGVGANAIIAMHIEVSYPMPLPGSQFVNLHKLAELIKVSAYGTAVYAKKTKE